MYGFLIAIAIFAAMIAPILLAALSGDEPQDEV